ncbi:hypothetical protein EVAR_88248_1 [Eumeta japonica]|uniref:Uncharacterized protein n=1 Tax=Eumeta variegata TaxID=151549 RepID=A0A4C1Z2R9_EUMVA|nr:hypothetical protein EVAR_88248_1 [Eumeta japonica]
MLQTGKTNTQEESSSEEEYYCVVCMSAYPESRPRENGYNAQYVKCSMKNAQRVARTPQHNIIQRTTSSKLTVNDLKDPYSIWHKYLDEDMLQVVVKWTNES